MPTSRRVAPDQQRESEPLAFPDRPRRPRRVSGGALIPAILAILAAVFAYQALQDRTALTSIVIARTSIVVGAPVSWSDVRLVQVHRADAAKTRGLLPPSALGSPWVAAVSLQAGEPVTVSELSSPTARLPLGQMSIAVPQDQAVGGELSAGDFVDVIQGAADEKARYIAQDLRVVSVPTGTSSGGVLSGGSTDYFVVVAVNRSTALRVASALSESVGAGSAPIELVRSNGETATSVLSLRAKAPREGPTTSRQP